MKKVKLAMEGVEGTLFVHAGGWDVKCQMPDGKKSASAGASPAEAEEKGSGTGPEVPPYLPMVMGIGAGAGAGAGAGLEQALRPRAAAPRAIKEIALTNFIILFHLLSCHNDDSLSYRVAGFWQGKFRGAGKRRRREGGEIC
jgi:hypothetical protein